MARRRRNPLFRGRDVTPLLLIGGGLIAGASGLLGSTVKASLSTVGQDIRATFGGKAVTVSSQGVTATSGTGGGPGGANDIGGSGIYTGRGDLITIAANRAGIYDASTGASAKYGAALWSLQSGQPQAAFYQQSDSVRATFSAVAVGQR